MQHFYGLDDVSLKGAWLSIGSFDGVHVGHQVSRIEQQHAVLGHERQRTVRKLSLIHPHRSILSHANSPPQDENWLDKYNLHPYIS